jgi:histidine triad (HIT) family protein
MTSETAVKDCAFCQLVRGEDPDAEVICEGQTWLAFFPLHPATPGHTLVIPRSHVVDLWEVEPALGSDLMQAVLQVGRAIERALSPEGMNLITSAGRVAEQTIFHLHLHIVPRWNRDGFGRIWPMEKRFQNDDLEDVADRIRSALSDA